MLNVSLNKYKYLQNFPSLLYSVTDSLYASWVVQQNINRAVM